MLGGPHADVGGNRRHMTVLADSALPFTSMRGMYVAPKESGEGGRSDLYANCRPPVHAYQL